MDLLNVLRCVLQAGGYDNRWDGSRPASRYESALASGLDGELDEGKCCCVKYCCGRLQGDYGLRDVVL